MTVFGWLARHIRVHAGTWTQHTWRLPFGSLPATRMPRAYEGVLIKTDAALRQYIMHLDEQQQKTGASFVVSSDLDDHHLLVKEEALEMIQQKVEELQNSNSFSRVELEADGKQRDDKKPRKRRDTS